MSVILLVDVSVSMSGGPIEAVNKALSEIQHSNPLCARIGLVTFSDEGRVAIPLCDLTEAHLPELLVEGGTNFAAGFRSCRQAIESGMMSLPTEAPVVYFVSAGAHRAREDWTGPLRQLRDPSWKFAPEVVAFGLGQAHAESLRMIATRFAFMANDQDPVTQVREIMKALIGSIRTASKPDPPAEHFTPLPAITIRGGRT